MFKRMVYLTATGAVLAGLAIAQTPLITSVVNGGDFSSALSPGTLAQVFGSDLWTASTACTPAAGAAVPKCPAVSIGGKPAYVSFASPGELNIVIPFEATPGPTTITVTSGSLVSLAFSLTLSAVSPAVFQGTPANIAEALTSTFTVVSYAVPAAPSEFISVYATGLGVTNPSTATPATGTSPTLPANALAVAPTLTIGGVAAPISSALYINPGLVQVVATVPAAVQGTQPVIVTSGTSHSAPAPLPVAGVTRLVSNGGFGSVGLAAPGEIATVFANGLGIKDQTTGFPDTTFLGSQVTFNGTAAPIFHLIASSGQVTSSPETEQQIDLLLPQELPTSGTVNVALMTGAGSATATTYPNYPIKMAPAVPGLYRLQDPGKSARFNIIAQFANTTWLALPASMTANLKLPACSATTNPLSLCGRPATAGDYLVIYLTGLGLTTPSGDPNAKPLATNQVPPADGSVLYETPTLPTITVGGVPARILYSGLAPGFPGLYQLDIQVPAGVAPGDDVPVGVSMFGNTDTATVSVQSGN